MRRNRLSLSNILIALRLHAFPVAARAADPIRKVVLSRHAESVQTVRWNGCRTSWRI